MTHLNMNKKRKDLVLYLLDLVLLGIVIAAFSWVFEVYTSRDLAVVILVFSLSLALILRARLRRTFSM